ncbi:hypothetical protein QJQ58_00660 [Paenibacillus dendritiformis]|nr:hypothetical protein [Paenibacillus dendritiformis]WGU94824.1 hypothetical protein QJQ58_00660 [Paenibacillus dendritiformis]
MTLLQGCSASAVVRVAVGLMTDRPLSASKRDNVASCARASLGFAAAA